MKICFIATHSPYGSTLARDAIESLLVAATFDQEGSLLAMGDGVYQLLDNQQPDSLPQKNTSSMIQALEMYGVEDIYVCHEDLEERGLTVQDLVTPVRTVERGALPSLLKEQDRILNF